MIDELKLELEKTFSRKITDRGQCEALVQDIYEKTGALLSYNTVRRLFGLAEYRKPRESTLDYLSKYCGFMSYQDFRQRFAEVDTWPTWESLFVVLATNNMEEILRFLRIRKAKNDYFTISFVIAARELIHRSDQEKLLLLFREPAFQFKNLPYDQVAQIGVLIGIQFRNFHSPQLERTLLQEVNFRDIVFKLFVDYAALNEKYGKWIHFLEKQKDLDLETIEFIQCIKVWRKYLMKIKLSKKTVELLPTLNANQHPILFGRIFGMRYLTEKSEEKKNELIQIFNNRLMIEPSYATEFLYEPCVQCLVLNNQELKGLLKKHIHLLNNVKFWYHFSQVSIHRVFQVSVLLEEKNYMKAKNLLNGIHYEHLRHGYQEFISLYISFFNWEISKELGVPNDSFRQIFLQNREKLSYPIFTDTYFENYFKKHA